MDLDLAGRVVLVGGASRGIGRTIAAAFLAEGAQVVMVARDGAALESERAALAAEHGNRVVAVAGDLTDAAEIERILDRAEAVCGPLYAVIAAVGSGRSIMGSSIGAPEWDRMLRLNLTGSALLAEAALRRLCPRRAGCVTFIGSIAGSERLRAPIAYTAAKAALSHAMKAYAAEAGPAGVRVNLVAPGNVLCASGVWRDKLDQDAQAVADYLAAEVPLRRLARPEDIAAAVVFLSSPRSAFTTGAEWVIDGGQTRSL